MAHTKKNHIFGFIPFCIMGYSSVARYDMEITKTLMSMTVFGAYLCEVSDVWRHLPSSSDVNSKQRCHLNKLKMVTSEECAAHKMIIRYCVDHGMTPIETKLEMESTSICGKVSRTLVCTWHKRFSIEWTGDIGENRGRLKKNRVSILKQVKDVIFHTWRQVAYADPCDIMLYFHTYIS